MGNFLYSFKEKCKLRKSKITIKVEIFSVMLWDQFKSEFLCVSFLQYPTMIFLVQNNDPRPVKALNH